MEISPILNSKAPSSQGSAGIDIKLKKACKDFESLMVSQMMSQMRQTVQKTDLYGSGKQEGMFQEMLDNEVAKKVSDTGSMGIADILYSQLSGQIKKA